MIGEKRMFRGRVVRIAEVKRQDDEWCSWVVGVKVISQAADGTNTTHWIRNPYTLRELARAEVVK